MKALTYSNTVNNSRATGRYRELPLSMLDRVVATGPPPQWLLDAAAREQRRRDLIQMRRDQKPMRSHR
jgi:hypothetical protein